MKIGHLLDYDEYRRALAQGFITERAHPDYPDRLFILNYTEKAQYENVWNNVTKTCRGLIYDLSTGDVLARPFAKFYNYGDEANTGQLDPDSPILGAWDKLDGSLGIGYNLPNGKPAIATRGSFASEQAIHATELYNRYITPGASHMQFPADQTFLYEIIYPENRIVVNYGDTDRLFFLGAVNIETGAYTSPVGDNSGGSARLLYGGTLRDALSLPEREGKEGMVIWLDEYTPVKVKQADYVALHKIVTGLSEKSIWRALANDDETDYLMQLPDEFFNWAQDVRVRLINEAYAIEDAAIKGFERALLDLGYEHASPLDRDERKEFALHVKGDPLASYYFMLLDGRDIHQKTVLAVEPKGE